MNLNDVVRDYGLAWTTGDEGERRALLERCWADDGVYCDPLSRVQGREALSRHIAGFAQCWPGARILLASGVDGHDGYLRFRWVMRDASGKVTLEGFDVGELAPDGRLARITGFFGPFPPVPEGWPERLVDRRPAG